MKLSLYQKKILEWVKTGRGNACCNAVAGSGKSTTLKYAALALRENGVRPSQIKICVFGKANANDLIEKFGLEWKSSISTLHSTGFFLVKRYLGIWKPTVDKNKYRKIAQGFDLIGRRGYPIGNLRKQKALDNDADFLELLDLVRLTNKQPTPGTIAQICQHFELPDVRDFTLVSRAIAKVLAAGKNQASDESIFDYTDMLWLPVHWRVDESRGFRPWQFVLVDEAQDLNATQLELACMMVGDRGRMLFVGDPRQAIMGFAGADCDSYQNIVRHVRGTELPLSLCYRCPTKHIELVRGVFPKIPIEAFPENEEGVITTISEKTLFGEEHGALREQDLVLCRKTAPLVSLCIKLIGAGMSATVKGRAIGDTLKKVIEEIERLELPFAEFSEAISLYRKAKAERYKGMDNEEELLEQLTDKVDAIRAIYESHPEAKSTEDLGEAIDQLFSDEHSPITLCTVHRAKGLEADRVFIIEPGDMPMRWRNQMKWQKEQEDNILYVALTRSKRELFIVGDQDWGTEKGENQRRGWPELFGVDEPEPSISDYAIEYRGFTPLETSQCESISASGEEKESERSEVECEVLAPLPVKEMTQIRMAIADLPLIEKNRLLLELQEQVNGEKENRVRSHILSNPGLSNRAIARELGFVSDVTVGRIRKVMEEQ
ncbi:UvrD-helicase domain-containing protein [Roseofilum reptotaenium CS-1145]|uniref:DNA 3'-5' helicase n=1 Tax=Roseofilum reptotaenium AO1-A TaxID=1925591 RepID=A0A1L9QN33_9CYAN|nr:UvrD-helicase domain-containing protein [Roseofilum reptotaenium]MDB9515753.1 UvrD-helicase domain-containing protein [Roseofilum reptotaenium CS-1145]OJJ24093.1 hypothetical protein BI308_18650 [Roseofilum reptotaenium AO1-A]